MISYRTILTTCFALFLSSCATTPVLTVKGDISREIKQKAPIVTNVDISPDGRYVLSGGFGSFMLWDIARGEKIQTFAEAQGKKNNMLEAQRKQLWADK